MFSNKSVEMDNYEVKSDLRNAKPLNSMSKNQKYSHEKVIDLHKKLVLWRDESHKQFLNIVDTHINIINDAMNTFVEEVNDLQAQLSASRKERNDLIETVRTLSGKIKKQHHNEDPQDLDSKDVEHKENEGSDIERHLNGYEDFNEEEEIKDKGNISDEALSQQALNGSDTESYLTFNAFEDMDAIDMDDQGVYEKDNSQTDHEEKENLSRSVKIESKKLVGPDVINPLVESAKVPLPLSTLKQMGKSVQTNREKTFKCEQCPYASLQKYRLIQHIAARHTKIKNIACGECSYVTTCKSNLYNHRKSCKMGNNKLSWKLRCALCPYSAVRKDNLEKHILRRH